MAEIDNVYLSIGGQYIAFAQSADFEPANRQLTVTDVTWVNGPGSAPQYLQLTCEVQGNVAEQDWNGNFEITGIDGNYQTVWLAQV